MLTQWYTGKLSTSSTTTSTSSLSSTTSFDVIVDPPVPSTGSLWTPAQIGSSLALWLDADDSGTITLNGTDVAAWADKSGNGYDLSQATAAEQPLYVSSGLNGKPTIRTDGTERLISATTSLFRDVDSATWVAVAKYTNTPISNGMLLYCSTGANTAQTRLGLTADPTGGTFLGVAGRRQDSDSYATALSSTATSTVLNSWIIEVGQGDYGNAEANHWTDGVQDLTAASFQTAGNTSNTDPLFVSVFVGTPGAPASPANTEIAEAIAIEGSLSTKDRQNIEGYLAWKWGLEGNLPAAHPYIEGPPLLDLKTGGVISLYKSPYWVVRNPFKTYG